MKKIYFFPVLILLFNFALFSKEISTGAEAPNIILRDINNKLVISKNILKNRPVLISFFFTACVPCKKEIPELEELNKKYKEKIDMFLIATDKEGADAVKPYMENMNITIRVLIDKYSDVAGIYKVTKYPSTFIIGKSGKIVYSCEGYKKENIKRIDEIIRIMK